MFPSLTPDIVRDHHQNLFMLISQDTNRDGEVEYSDYNDWDIKALHSFLPNMDIYSYPIRKKEAKRIFHPEVNVQKRQEFVESKRGNETIKLADGSVVKADIVIKEYYSWIKPKNTVSFLNWIGLDGYVYENKYVTSEEVPKSDKFPGLGPPPKSILSVRYKPSLRYFCLIPDIKTLNEIIKEYVNVEFNSGGLDRHHYEGTSILIRSLITS